MDMNALLSVNTIELLSLWGELLEAYHGVNGWGSDTAEIYAYRFYRYDPFIAFHHRDDEKPTEYIRRYSEQARLAADALVELCELFKSRYDDAYITIDGVSPKKWLDSMAEFDHRAHVKVIQRRQS